MARIFLSELFTICDFNVSERFSRILMAVMFYRERKKLLIRVIQYSIRYYLLEVFKIFVISVQKKIIYLFSPKISWNFTTAVYMRQNSMMQKSSQKPPVFRVNWFYILKAWFLTDFCHFLAKLATFGRHIGQSMGYCLNCGCLGLHSRTFFRNW